MAGVVGRGAIHLDLLAAAAAGEQTGVRFLEGPTAGWYSFADLSRRARRTATALVDAGAVPGDRVVMLVSNRVEFLDVWFGCSFAQLISVPLNTEFRGAILQNLMATMAPRVAVVDAELLPNVIDVLRSSPSVKTVLCVGEPGVHPVRQLAGAVELSAEIDVPAEAPTPSTVATIFYTSGTTGTSKGVTYTHGGVAWVAHSVGQCYGFTSDDVAFSVLPLFHINALLTALYASVLHHARCVMAERFSASRYWAQAVESEGTVTSMIGSISTLLWTREPEPLEVAHRLRRVQVLPIPVSGEEFGARFGFEVMEGYGSTEASYVTGMLPGDVCPPGSAGRLLEGWELKLVDADDVEVPIGQVGEAAVRPTYPFIAMQGYWGEPAATVAVWRNLWLHLGDLLRRDEEGWYWYVGRARDALRRSGENISEQEVEQAVLLHPGIEDCVAYGVPSELGEQDVAVVIVAADDFDVTRLRKHCEEQLPYFAVPRFIAVCADFPRTLTGKIRKELVRSDEFVKAMTDFGRTARSSTNRSST